MSFLSYLIMNNRIKMSQNRTAYRLLKTSYVEANRVVNFSEKDKHQKSDICLSNFKLIIEVTKKCAH